MRLFLLTILVCTWLLTTLLLLGESPSSLIRLVKNFLHDNDIASTRLPTATQITSDDGEPWLSDIGEMSLALELYEDPDYGFAVAVPRGWTRIVAAESIDQASIEVSTDTDSVSSVGSGSAIQSLEPGYAVGFESGVQGNAGFTDYILIEVLPGITSGLFEADPMQRRQVVVDGHAAGFDRLEVASQDSDLTEADLLILQTEFSGVGYTIGLYAIGEIANEPVLVLVFEAMLQTFELRQDPFTVG